MSYRCCVGSVTEREMAMMRVRACSDFCCSVIAGWLRTCNDAHYAVASGSAAICTVDSGVCSI